MGVKLGKDSIDIGIVISDSEKALAFYRDTLGLEHVADTPMGGAMVMHRLMCGTTLVKLVNHNKELPAKAAPGGIQGATGYRYWTITVTNLQELTDSIEAAGYKVVVPVREIRPGVSISIVEDPEGNWVEFLQQA
jgi:catechol 2,3-dioxygenase-like lactoylglutathione lyase family enzyme